MDKQCLFCYQKLAEDEIDFHSRCSKKMFGTPEPPTLEFSLDQIMELAEQVIQSQSAITGVQPKLSLGLKRMSDKDKPQKFTIMGLWGRYILKPPSEIYRELPELEDLTMHLAEIAGIRTVPHSLIRLRSGEISYITKRIDRGRGEKFHMEDMAQLTERLTEAKYRGSHEQIARALIKFSKIPGLDLINYFEQVVFCFLTGNNDMHFKNFSLLKDPALGYILSPAYDMVASALVVEGDDEELALTINGKKRNIERRDFEVAIQKYGLDSKAIDNIFRRFQKAFPKWKNFIDTSFLSSEMKVRYHQMIDQRFDKLHLEGNK